MEITPSMNFLVHNLIEKVPGAAINLFPSERNRTLDRINPGLLRPETSFGEYIRKAVEGSKLIPAIVCEAVGHLIHAAESGNNPLNDLALLASVFDDLEILVVP